MNEIRKFIQWLSFHPTSDDIARAFATDYLNEFSTLGVRYSRLQSDDSTITLGQFGFQDSLKWEDRVIHISKLCSRDTEPASLLKAEIQENWCNESTVFIQSLSVHGVTQGYLIVAFHKTINAKDKDRVAKIIQDLCLPLSLYLSFQSRYPADKFSSLNVINDTRAAGSFELTPRQLSILRGMVESKTNHELATEMGYSVSTIRHETMRIYQALAVSDRKEAAKKALTLSLL
jgi:DNA-binding CsgD family transcriptional regulator